MLIMPLLIFGFGTLSAWIVSLLFHVYVCVCMYMCVYIQRCTCVYACMGTWLCKCMWKPKIDIGVFLDGSLPSSLGQGLSVEHRVGQCG